MTFPGSAKESTHDTLNSSKDGEATQFISKLMKQENQKLRSAGIQLTLERRENWLSLRGYFPPRPYSGRSEPHQQNLSLKIYVSESDIKQARRNLAEAVREARKIWQQLLSSTFNWEEYLRHKKKLKDFIKKQNELEEQESDVVTFKDLFIQFKEYFDKNNFSEDPDNRWKDLSSGLRFLDTEEEFSEEKLREKTQAAIDKVKATSTKKKILGMVNQYFNFLKESIKDKL